jgi:hypothetical protein
MPTPPIGKDMFVCAYYAHLLTRLTGTKVQILPAEACRQSTACLSALDKQKRVQAVYCLPILQKRAGSLLPAYRRLLPIGAADSLPIGAFSAPPIGKHKFVYEGYMIYCLFKVI